MYKHAAKTENYISDSKNGDLYTKNRCIPTETHRAITNNDPPSNVVFESDKIAINHETRSANFH